VRLRARELESGVDYLHMRTILLNTVVVLFAVSPLFALDWLRSRSRWIAQYHDELSLGAWILTLLAVYIWVLPMLGSLGRGQV